MPRVKLALAAHLAVGDTRVVLHRGPPPYRTILVVRTQDGLHAYWNVCKHLPVPLDAGALHLPLEQGALVCKTHGARYRPEDGFCTEGPCAGESLERLEVEVEDGIAYARVPPEKIS